MATLTSVNVGMPRNVEWNQRTVYTGAWKQPVTGPRMVRRLNVDGDGQGDLGGHGGENRAVLVYQLDSYRHWAQVFDRDDLAPGLLGENLTVDGLPDDEVCIGDRYRIGQAVLEVTQPRVTCYRAGMRIGEPRMAALLVSHGRPGFYCRVITEGEVEAGQEIVKIELRTRAGVGRRDRRTALSAWAFPRRPATRTAHPGTEPRLANVPPEPGGADPEPGGISRERRTDSRCG